MNPINNQRGVALLLTLVVLVLLTAVIVEFDYGAKVNLITAGNFRDESQATYLAKAGVTAARAALKEDANDPDHAGYDGLDEMWAQNVSSYPAGEGFVSAQITDEAGKIDVNRLGNSKTQVVTDTQDMLKRLLRVLEIDPNLIDPIVEAVKNWVDPDPTHTCAEEFYYQRQNPSYRCKKAPMDTLSELLLVKGMTPEIYRKIRPYLTTVSAPTTPININTADLPVLEALADDITSDTANCIQTGRPYKLINTQIWTACATSCLTTLSCKNQLGVKSSYFTVEAHGTMHETEKIATAMIERKGTVMKLLSWQIE